MKKIFLISTIAIALIACKNENHHENHDEHEHHDETATHEEDHHNHESEAIMLNDGEKWKVVENMSGYIRNMEKALNEFEGEDYPTLAKTIDENIRALTENCTMEGQAHDELHKWLLPFIELSEEFDVATEKENQEKIYQEFKKMFVEYNTYFE
mgnify:CR=1 FL=1|jgi:ABC-type Zn2+ transport system substrate-binding protein/surface adhesin